MTVLPAHVLESEFERLNRLAFSPAVERLFEARTHAQRVRQVRWTLLAAVILYDIFLITDLSLLRDMLPWSALSRLGVFTPIMLVLIALLPRTTRLWQVDAIVAGGTTLAVLLPSTLMVFSVSGNVLLYQFGTVLTMIYMAMVQRVQFRMAAFAIAIILAIQFTTVGLRPEIDPKIYEFVVAFYLTAAALMLMGSFMLERTERYGFLHHLRSQSLIAEIDEMARRDQLTGLYNRHHLASLQRVLVRDAGAGRVAALMIDIDHFKRFNDATGHLAGDRCIQFVGTLIRDVLADAEQEGLSGVSAFRFGGEEFLVLLPGLDAARAAAIGERIRLRLEAAALPHPDRDGGDTVTLSIGVADGNQAGFDLDALVGAADAALYSAKKQGRNRTVIA